MKFSKITSLITCFLCITSSSWATTYIYVVNAQANNITYFPSDNPSDQHIITNADFNFPFGLAITPNGLTAYVVNADGNNVITFPLANPSESTIISGNFNRPEGIAITPDGKKAYITNYLANNIITFPLDNPNDQTTISDAQFDAPSGITITPDGTTAYVANAFGLNVLSFPLANPTNNITVVLDTFPDSFGADGPFGIGITPDGTTVYVSPNQCIATSFLSFPTNNPSNVTVYPLAPLHPIGYIALLPDASTAYMGLGGGFCIDGSPAIVTFPFSNPEEISLVTGFDAPTGIATSPGPLPARNLTGFQKKNRFVFEYELFNQLNWTASFGVATTAYHIYRDGSLIATEPATQLQYRDHNRKPGVSYRYEVVSVNAQGIESSSATIIIP